MSLHIVILFLSLACATAILRSSAPPARNAELVPEAVADIGSGLGSQEPESRETTWTGPHANGTVADLVSTDRAWIEALADAAAEAELAWGANTTIMPSLQNGAGGEVLEIEAAQNVVQLVIPCDTGPIIEQAWIERLTSGCGSVKIQCLEHLASTGKQRMVFVVMIHKNHFRPLAYNVHQRVIKTMQRLGQRPSNHVMVHIGDEWEVSRGIKSQSGHLEDPAWSSLQKIYRPWAKVFRQFDNGMDTYIPLGWTPKFATWDMYKKRIVPASDRDHALSFIGRPWAERGGQIEAYQKGLQASGLTLNRERDQLTNSTVDHVGHSRYVDEDPRYSNTLANSAFCLQLAGASSECYRLYEALEVGCIPVVRAGWGWQNFAGKIGGQHASALPFLFAEPENAGMKIRDLLANPQSLNKLQQQNMAWWEKVKRKYTFLFAKAICPPKGKGKGKGKFKGKFKRKFKAKA